MKDSLGIFITFDGNCVDALKFYGDIFTVLPEQVAKYPDFDDKIMFSQLTIGGTNVMLCDTPPDVDFIPGNNIVMNYANGDFDQLRHVFDGLKNGGEVRMELQEMFFSPLYGMVKDKFGIYWNILAQ
ncbi:MAG: VOC family protein [Defluviitaleaceae bacterium]|nr:VOC family protein [Defluviitaleaceae bacterium]